MDLLDGPGDADVVEPDVVEMDPPPRPWERYARKWQQRWLESGRITRTAIAGGAIAMVVGGAGAAYTVTRSATPAAPAAPASPGAVGNVSPQTRPPLLWADGPHGKPWAVVGTGSAIMPNGMRIGTVTAVSRTSLAIASPGGYGATYRVTAATQVNARGDDIGSIRKGELVNVIATREGKNSAALAIETLTAAGNGRHKPDKIVVVYPVAGTPAPEITGP